MQGRRVIRAENVAPCFRLARNPYIDGRITGKTVCEQFLEFRIGGIDCRDYGILRHSETYSTLFFFGRIYFTRNHAEIDYSGQYVGHTLTGTASRNINTYTRVQGLKLFCPLNGYGIERKRTRKRQLAAQFTGFGSVSIAAGHTAKGKYA